MNLTTRYEQSLGVALSPNPHGGNTLHRRTAILSIVAVLSLSAAGYAAANGRPPGGHGKPSTTPPPWSHPHGHVHH
jgi:hypothetical protein